MQQANNIENHFKKISGGIIKKLRNQKTKSSINNFARQFDIDRGNLSKIERGIGNCRLITAYKISQALGIKFSEFAKMLEDELGEDFSLIDE